MLAFVALVTHAFLLLSAVAIDTRARGMGYRPRYTDRGNRTHNAGAILQRLEDVDDELSTVSKKVQVAILKHTPQEDLSKDEQAMSTMLEDIGDLTTAEKTVEHELADGDAITEDLNGRITHIFDEKEELQDALQKHHPEGTPEGTMGFETPEDLEQFYSVQAELIKAALAFEKVEEQVENTDTTGNGGSAMRFKTGQNLRSRWMNEGGGLSGGYYTPGAGVGSWK